MSVKNDLDKLAKNIIKDAKANVPVRSGKLKNSLDYEVNYNNDDNFNIVINELEYGKYVDKGTKNQKADNFMTDAIKKNLDKGIKQITDSIVEDILKPLNDIE